MAGRKGDVMLVRGWLVVATCEGKRDRYLGPGERWVRDEDDAVIHRDEDRAKWQARRRPPAEGFTVAARPLPFVLPARGGDVAGLVGMPCGEAE
jgi:hypothetical protein